MACIRLLQWRLRRRVPQPLLAQRRRLLQPLALRNQLERMLWLPRQPPLLLLARVTQQQRMQQQLLLHRQQRLGFALLEQSASGLALQTCLLLLQPRHRSLRRQLLRLPPPH